MKHLLTLMIGLSWMLPQMASAAPKEKDKPTPPGQARKAAAAGYSGQSRSPSGRTYEAPAVRSTSRSSSSDRWDSNDRDRRYSNDRDGRYSHSDRDNDRYRSSHRYSRPSVNVYRNWDRRRVYSWNNNRYRWYGGTWVIYDASPRVVYTESAVGGSVVASVQSELRRRGYDAGPADGVMGGRTRSAILNFQADHGLSRTGRITESLLRALDLA
jgi:hypothetical protein